jgi:hypothetical protein
MERIAVLFDIDDLGGSNYGQTAWGIFFATIEPVRLQECAFSHGDTDQRIAGKRRPYCWAIAVDCDTSGQVSYVRDIFSKSQAKGLMPATARFAQGRMVMEQPLVPSIARIDNQGFFVLLDDAYVWLLIAADKAGWKYKLDSRCVARFVQDFVDRYKGGFRFGSETNIVLARTFGATGGPEAEKALLVGLQEEESQEVKQEYKRALEQLRMSGKVTAKRWWQFWKM